jgi:hypothetical protein
MVFEMDAPLNNRGFAASSMTSMNTPEPEVRRPDHHGQ